MRSRAPFSAQLRVFHQNISCSMHTFPLELSPSGSSHSIVRYAFVYIMRLTGHTHDRESPIQTFPLRPKNWALTFLAQSGNPNQHNSFSILVIYVVTPLQHSNPSRVREMRAFLLEAINFTVSVPPLNLRHD